MELRFREPIRSWSYRAVAIAGALATLLSTSASAAVPRHRYAGITCGTDPKVGAVACVRRDGRGLVAGISGQLVAIQNRDGTFLFAKKNFGTSSRRVAMKTWFAFYGVRCGIRPPSTVECLRADGVGYGVTISRFRVSVVRLSDMKRVYEKLNSG